MRRIRFLLSVTLSSAAVLVSGEVPVAAQSAGTARGTGLDQALARENASTGVKAAPTATVDDLTYLRRVTIDLIGRIPTEAEVRGYLARPAVSRRQAVVERLLQDPRFADRWTIFFGDMLRLRNNAEGGGALTAFVHQSIAKGMPYDELVRRLIRTNGKVGQSPEVGFVLGDNADAMALAGVTSQLFLGVRIACAQCHDHPFDKWKRKDFYQFAAYFGKTRRIQRRFNNRILATYTTEVPQTSVLWPPEGAEDESPRKPIAPKFPITLASVQNSRHFVSRLQQVRATRKQQQAAALRKPRDATVDDLLERAARAADKRSRGEAEGPGVAGLARGGAKKLELTAGGYQTSSLRAELARLVTHPRNRYFSRAFVNRMWAELIGRGFVQPIDDFNDNNPPSHPQTLNFLADEFVAGGYDLRKLARLIVSSGAYQRRHAAGVDETTRTELEAAFLAVPMRRMISEALYDSIVTAGHLFSTKHEPGKNLKVVWRLQRIMKRPKAAAGQPIRIKPQPLAGRKSMPLKAAEKDRPATGYDLEKAIELDFAAVLKRSQQPIRLGRMQVKSREELEAERMQQETRRQQAEYIDRFVRAQVDDNPRFGSAARMAAPAAPEHFLRVFGQPGRSELGDFREDAPSMRQALMMLNGRLSHEAARVGELEPVYPLLVGKQADLTKAVKLVYREILTREPSAEELADARSVISAAKSPLAGMADLRWVLLNSNEFRFLP